jgi:hypothetical protein
MKRQGRIFIKEEKALSPRPAGIDSKGKANSKRELIDKVGCNL